MARPNLVDKVEAMAAPACVPGLRPSALKVGLRLLHHYNGQTRRCDPGIETLAYATGLCERAVYRAISELEKLGLFRILHRRGRGNTNSYVPEFEKIKRYNPPARSVFPNDGSDSGQNLTGRAHKPDEPVPGKLTAGSEEHMNEHVKEHVMLSNRVDDEHSGGSSEGVACQQERVADERDVQTRGLAWWAKELEARGIDRPVALLHHVMVRAVNEGGLSSEQASELVSSCLQIAIDVPNVQMSLNQQLSQAIAELDANQ